jgi:2-phosphosulfolactate phosphatase
MKKTPFLPQVHLDWTVDGLRFALREGRIVVVADILRFSSAVTTAVANGFTVYPVADQRKVAPLARRVRGQAAGRSGEARFSLSPFGYLDARDLRNKKVVLWSPNGAACASMIKKGHRAYVGCLLNARALGVHLTRIAGGSGRNVTLIAAGEQQAVVTGERILYDIKSARRVFAVEDYLGCGAILSYTRLPKSPEAKVCELAFRASRRRLRELMMASFSGRFLKERKLSRDVAWAAQLNKYDVVPVIRGGRIEAALEYNPRCQRRRS